MSTIFDTVMMSRPKLNHFNMSYDRKLSMEMGRLYPIHNQAILPGDKFTHKTQQMIRFAPMIAPMMHKVDVFIHYWFVPNRIMWDGWEEFITGADNPNRPDFPYITPPESVVNLKSIQDYLDVPTGAYNTQRRVKYSALPTMAYWLIWYEWYRDQNLQTEEQSTIYEELTSLIDGDNTSLLSFRGLMNVPFKRAWTHDYFTSALPFAQKGDAVTIPLGQSADIRMKDGILPASMIRTTDGSFVQGNGNIAYKDNGVINSETGQPPTDTMGRVIDNSQAMFADLTTATATTINDLRRAYKLQSYLEKNARGGTRYAEMILSHFGVRSSDARLQRPEYLGGGIAPVSVSEVVQNSQSEFTPQGNLAGHAISVGQSFNYSKRFEEHGYVIGLMSVMPKPAYSQGLDRELTKFDPLDFYWESFATIGEQEIKKSELKVTGTNTDDETFGYIPRYAEYRQNFSRVNGDFRDTLEYWHMARKFANTPSLNASFIECDATKRIFAVQDIPDSGSGNDSSVRTWDTLYCHIYHDIDAIRPIPKYDAPSW